MTEPTTWLNQRERGTLFGIALAFRLAGWVGRRPMRPVVSAVALWYRLFDRKAVRASRAWLTRVHGREPGYWDVYRHIRVFAQVTLDRVFLLTDRTRGFEFTRTGHQNLQDQIATGRGAVLLGAHLGSYEAMRAGGVEDRVPINILGYFENAKMIGALIERLNPDLAMKVIDLSKDPVSVMASVGTRVEAGELVALLGDRVGLNERIVRVPFFGQEAAFPAGPFLLASLLKCPVYLVFGLFSEPNRYDLYCLPFRDRIELPRRDRERALHEVVRDYAERLEGFARRAPYNWFNFFDFWETT